jgi:hypothetical protein
VVEICVDIGDDDGALAVAVDDMPVRTPPGVSGGILRRFRIRPVHSPRTPRAMDSAAAIKARFAAMVNGR